MRTSFPFARTQMRRRLSWTRGIAAFAVAAGVSLAMLFGNSPTAKGYAISNTNEVITTTGGGGYIGPANCPAGSVIYQMGATGDSGSTSLTRPVGTCADLNGPASLHSTVTGSIGTTSWGGAGNTTLTPVRCSSAQAVVGMVVHKQANGYVAGWQLMCGSLPTGGSRTTDSVTFGWSNAGTSSPTQRETITCPTGMVAVGMSAYVGLIMDRIGLRCGTISGADQAAVTITSSASINYGSTLTLSSSGGSGYGATTYSATGNCSVSGTTLTATGNAGTTCSVTATRAADTNYALITSATQTVTIARAANTISFTNPTTKTWSSTPFNVTTSASSGVTPSITSTTTSVCSVSGIAVTMLSSGTCSLTATQGETTNHVAAVAVVQSFTINPVGRTAFVGNSATISGTTTGSKYVVERFTTTGASTWSVPQGVTGFEYVVVGGGGAGGTAFTDASSGGGGGGEVVTGSVSSGIASSYTVTVGAGGAATGTFPNPGGNGLPTTLAVTSGSTVATGRGGGGGSSFTSTGTSNASTTGFTGGGGGSWAASTSLGSTGTGGASFKGGNARGDGSDANLQTGGAGGGAGGAGGAGTSTAGGVGGIGVSSSLAGSTTSYGGGGGGGKRMGTSGSGGNGTDGGGNGGRASAGSAGTANTGGGGGGAGNPSSGSAAGGAGGTGIVVVRYVLPTVTTPNLLGADDTGTNTDDITSTRTLRFFGNAPLTASVQISVAAASSASDTDATTGEWTNTGSACTANSTGGEWECTTAQLSPGLYKVRSTATTKMDGLTDTTTSTTALVVNIDTTTPTVTLTRSGTGPLNAGQTETITFTLSEASSTFAADDITVTGGTIGTLTTTSSTVYSVVFTPTANTNAGTGTLLVASTRFTDTAGNNNTASSTTSITYDTLRPTIALSGCTASYAAGATCSINITLSDSVSDLVLADFNVTRGSLSGLTTTGTSRTVTYTATGPIAGTSAVSVAAGAITDANGNTNNASNVLNVTVASSNARQLMTSLSASGVSVADNTSGASRYIVQTFAATGSTTWTAPQGVTGVDLLVVGGGGGAGSRGAGGGGAGGYIEASNYTVTPGSAYSVVVGGGGAGATAATSDSGAAGSPSSFTLSSVGPTANGGSPGLSHSTYGNGGASGTRSGTGGTSYNSAGGSGAAFGTCGTTSDWCGGGGGGATTAGATAATSGGNGGTGRSSSITGTSITFAGGGGGGGGDSSDPSNSPTPGGNGGAGGGGNGGSPTWDGTNCIAGAGISGTINSGGGGGGGSYCSGSRVSGNYNGGGGSGGSGIVVVRYLVAAPSTPDLATASDSGSSSTDNITKNQTLTFIGNAPVTASVQLSVATASSASDTDPTTGTWTDTGSTCTADTTTGAWSCATASLSPGLYKVRSTATTTLDGIADTQTSSAALVVNVDTSAPTVTLTRSGAGLLTVGQTETITFTLSEASSTFAVDDITITGGTIGTLTTTSSTEYSVVFTPTANTNAGTGTLLVASTRFTDTADNNNTASSTMSILYDTLRPTVLISANPSSVTSGSTSTVTFTVSESVTTFTSADVSSTFGTLTNFSGSGTSYTATFTASPSTGGTAVITVASGSITDANTNANASAFTSNITITNTTSSTGGRTSYLANGTNGTNGTRYFVEQFITAGSANWVAPQGVTSVEYLVVAGGGGGGGANASAHGGGGGGAGGYRTNASGETSGGGSSPGAALSVTPGTSYSVLVGAGGNGGSATLAGTKGGNSQFSSITALGGGGGGAYYNVPTTGGSGGGAAASTDNITGANGETGQGYKGGNTPTQDFTTNGAGGGGSSGVGTNGVNLGTTAAGGVGTPSSITGSSTTRAAGGPGGLGNTSVAGTSGTINTGNGGGGGSAVSNVAGVGGAGGSGIVVVRYAVPDVSTPDLDATDDLGTNNDNITAATTLTFTGSAPVGSTVQLFVDGVSSGSTCVANSSTGAWSCDTGVLTAGDKVITAESRTVLSDSTVTSTSSGLTVTIDTTPPTVSSVAFTSNAGADSTYKAGDTISVTVAFSENVLVTSTPRIALVGLTTKYATYASGSGTASLVFSYTVASGDNDSDGLAITADTLALNSGTITDTATNTATLTHSAVATQSAHKVDTTAPTVSLARSGSGTLKSGQTDTITFTLSEAATDFAVGDITVTDGTLSSFTASSSTVYTVIFTPTADTQSGSGSISVAGATFTDAAGNTNTASSATTITYDTLAPTVSLARSGSGTLKSGQTDTITFTLSEAATDFAVGDITVSGGTIGALTTTSSTVYSVVFTPTANTNSGTGTISVAGATFTDAAGNSNTASSATSISFDTLAPTVSLARSGSGTLNSTQTSTITFTLSEASSTFATDDITVAGGSIGTLTTTSSTVYSVVFTPTANTNSGTGTISVAGATFTDAAGNSNTASSATSISYDTAVPTVTITRAGSVLRSGITEQITFTLSEPSSTFAGDDITVSGGTIGALTTTSSTVYSGQFTPTTNTQSGTASISVAGATFTDAAGNTNTASNTNTFPYDTLAPTVSLVRTGSGPLKAGQTDTVTITFSEIGSFNGITSSGVTLSNYRFIPPNGRAIDFTPTAGTQTGSGSVSVLAGHFIDDAGNTNAESNVTFTFDTLVPTVAITRAGSTTLRSGQTDTITFTLSEASSTFTAADITVTGGSIGSLTTVSSTVYRVLFTPTADTESGTSTLSVAAAKFTDSADNDNTASNTLSIPFDTREPTVAITRAGSTTLRSGQTDTITFTLSEASSTFTAADITVTGGTIGALTTTSSTVYSVVFTPTTNTQSGTGSISVAAARFTDATGNGNIASSTRSVPYDTLTATISSVTSSTANGTIGIGSTASIQVVFSEVVTVTGTPQLTLETGTSDRSADYASGSGTDTLTFTYTVQSGDTASDLDYTSSSALTLNGGTIVDAANNSATLTLPTPGTSGSLGANKAIVVASEPTQVVSVRTPVGTASGAAFTTQPQVSLKDSGGAIVTSDSSTVVTATVSNGASLVGTITATSVSGIVTFNNLGITGTAGTAYTITYSATVNATALTTATQSVTPTVGAATKIAVSTQPVGDTAGALLSTFPSVSVLDSGNNVVTSATTSITVAPTGGTLGGTKTINAINGVASFADLTFAGTASTNYKLQFSTTSLGSTDSANFTVGVGAPTQLSIATNASGAKFDTSFTTQPVVEILDAGNNKVTTASNVVTATLSSGTVVGSNGSTLTATPSSGVATFSGLGITGLPGTYTITYSSGSLTNSSQTISLAKADQTITFSAPTGRPWSATAFAVTPTASSGLNVSLASTTTSICTVSALDVSMVTVGSCSLTATQVGNDYFNAAVSVSRSFTISQASQSISFAAPTDRQWSASTFTVAPTASSDLAVSLTSTTTAVCTVSSFTVTMVKAGTCTLSTSQAGNTNYVSATPVAHSFEISLATQTSLSLTSTMATFGANLTLTTSGGSGTGAVTYIKVSGDCTVAGTTMTPTAAGSCEVTATKAADTQYDAIAITRTVSIARANQSTPLILSDTTVIYGQTLTLSGSGGEGTGAISYAVSSGTCSLSSSTLTPGDAGSLCEVEVTRALSANYNQGTSNPISITIQRATPTLGSLTLARKTFGDAPFTLTAPSADYNSAAVPGSWTYSSAQVSVATINSSTVTVTGGGTSVLTATFAPTDSVNFVGVSTTSTLTVDKATPTFSWTNVSATYGDADFSIASPAVATTSATGTWTYSSANTSVAAIAGTKFDVLDAGTSVITATFTPANTTNYVSGGTITMTVTVDTANQTTLTISSVTGTYGTDLTLTTTGGSTNGIVTWGTVNGTATGCAISSGKLTTTSAGNCEVTATMAGNSNYNPVTNLGTTVTINAKPITVTAVAKTKTYGDNDPALTFTTTIGALVNNDTLSGSLTRVAGEDVAEYTINQGSVANTNYNITYTPAKLTIGAKPITVTAVAKTKTYGDADPALTFTTAVGALVGNDALAGSLTRVAGEDVAEYTINQGSVTNTNYNITYTTAKLTIGAKPITISANTQTKIYGDSDPALTFTTAVGALVGNDALAGSLTRVAGEDVGEFTINQGTVTNTNNTNYNITYTTAKLTIGAKPITVSADAKTKIYGETDPTLTVTIPAGSLVGSDTLTGTPSRVTGEDAGEYTINKGTVANSNYNITFTTAKLTIGQAQQSALTVTTANIVYRTPIALQASGGSEGGLSFSLATAGTASCSIENGTLSASGNAGSTCTVTATRAMTNNYVQKTSVPFTITVVPRTITLTATAKEKFYGDSDPGFTYVVTAGSLFGSDTFSGTQTRDTGENVGTYTINKGSLANSNYTITYVSAQLTINQRPITVTATDKTKIFGESDPLLAYTVTTGNIVNSDVFTGAITRAPGETVGSYNITQGTLDNGNYSITFVRGTFRITGAPQTGFTLTSSAYSVVYNESVTLQTSGGNGDGAISYASADGTGSCSISGDSVTGTAAGTCSVTATKAAEGGFLASTSDAITITIEKADQVILFSQLADRDFSTTAITVAPTSGSGSQVVLASRTPNVCKVELLAIEMKDSGDCSITASVAASRNHNAAPSIVRSFAIRAVVPFAPAITSVEPSDATVTVAFTPGLSGGAAITTYRYSVDDGVRWTDLPDGTITSPIVIGNLPNDIEAKVRIMAVNRIGAGARSNLKSATPVAKKSLVWATERKTNAVLSSAPRPSVGTVTNQLPPRPALVRTQSVSGGRRTQVTATRATIDSDIPVTHAIITVRLKNGKLLARIQVLVDPNNPTTAVTVPYQSRRVNISVQFANNVGISDGGTVGANLREGTTFLETTIDGRPRLAGTPIANGVSFSKGSSVLSAPAKARLKKALKTAQAQGGLIYITGYTQSGELKNSWLLNALARERAKKVAEYFVSLGARQWITFHGAPIAPTVWHNTPSGRVDIATVLPDQI